MTIQRLIFLAVPAVASMAMMAQDADKKMDKKPATAKPASASGVLQPQMNPEGGFTSSGTMGEKADQTWSATTIGAAVNGKPVMGKAVSVTGEIVDLSCYLQLGKHGEKHKPCGTKCLNSGQPIGLVTQAGMIYMLMEEEHDPRRDGQTTLRKAATDNLAKVVDVTGTETLVKGVHAIYVSGFVNK